MRLPEFNKNGSRLKVYIKGDVYSLDMFQSFSSVQELNDYMDRNFGVTRRQYEYFY